MSSWQRADTELDRGAIRDQLHHSCRDGQVLVPRLAPARPGKPADLGDGTVVLTGATGAPGPYRALLRADPSSPFTE